MNKLSVLCVLLATSAFADVSLNKIFSDHMVLQRDRAVPVWGKAEPGEDVTVRFGGTEVSAKADASGRWEVKLPAMKWNATAQELSAKGAKNEEVVKDVLVGDVWLVSGQSNSEMTFGWGIINGEEEKAKDIHPKNKFDVGHRLALWARRDVYGEKGLVVSGPLYKGMAVEGGKIRISFDHAGSGLMAAEKGPDTPGVAPVPSADGALKGFAIAGADKKWFWAKAEINGKDVVVYADEVKNPVAVRYAHRANPMGDCNLYNKEGLPASPFRTDSW